MNIKNNAPTLLVDHALPANLLMASSSLESFAAFANKCKKMYMQSSFDLAFGSSPTPLVNEDILPIAERLPTFTMKGKSSKDAQERQREFTEILGSIYSVHDKLAKIKPLTAVVIRIQDEWRYLLVKVMSIVQKNIDFLPEETLIKLTEFKDEFATYTTPVAFKPVDIKEISKYAACIEKQMTGKNDLTPEEKKRIHALSRSVEIEEYASRLAPTPTSTLEVSDKLTRLLQDEAEIKKPKPDTELRDAFKQLDNENDETFASLLDRLNEDDDHKTEDVLVERDEVIAFVRRPKTDEVKTDVWNVLEHPDFPFRTITSTTNGTRNFPPYDIIEVLNEPGSVLDENVKQGSKVILCMAMAGYVPNVEKSGNVLIISGDPVEMKKSWPGTMWRHRGISSAPFTRTFDLHPDAEVIKVAYVNGILSVHVQTVKKDTSRIKYEIKTFTEATA